MALSKGRGHSCAPSSAFWPTHKAADVCLLAAGVWRFPGTARDGSPCAGRLPLRGPVPRTPSSWFWRGTVTLVPRCPDATAPPRCHGAARPCPPMARRRAALPMPRMTRQEAASSAPTRSAPVRRSSLRAALRGTGSSYAPPHSAAYDGLIICGTICGAA